MKVIWYDENRVEIANPHHQKYEYENGTGWAASEVKLMMGKTR